MPTPCCDLCGLPLTECADYFVCMPCVQKKALKSAPLSPAMLPGQVLHMDGTIGAEHDGRQW